MGASWRVGIDDRPTQLVTGGLFSLSRNPIFSGMLLTLAGFILIASAAWLIVACAVALDASEVRITTRARSLPFGVGAGNSGEPDTSVYRQSHGAVRDMLPMESTAAA